MKTSKTSSQGLSQEECGVWLDTGELKGKAKQKRLARPISKLLNPSAKGGGYNLAVALNFTQTKMEMPKTTQSTISNYFTSHRRVLNKISSPGVQELDVSPNIGPGSKREPDGRLKKAKLDSPGAVMDQQQERENETEPEIMIRLRELNEDSALQYFCQSDYNLEEMCQRYEQPELKKRLTEKLMSSEDSQPPPPAWSQDPLISCSQNSDDDYYFIEEKQKLPEKLDGFEKNSLESLQSQKTFGSLVNTPGKTSTQKPSGHSFLDTDDDKENNNLLSVNSSKSLLFTKSHLNSKLESKNILPQKQTDQITNKVANEVWLDFKHSKATRSPLKKIDSRSREAYEAKMSDLFTQDSEGFRVIAHREVPKRSPLKSQSNVDIGMGKPFSSLEEEEEEYMLFTQDSQGNMVIKH